MKIAVLGGSFNPPHLAHLVLADCVCEELGYDKVIFVPCFTPPHKRMANAACARDRIIMVKKLIKGDSRFEVSDFEIKKQGVSYTWDTICFLEQKYKKSLTQKIGLILGYDLASHFENWKNAQELAQKCQLILAVRNKDYKNNGFSANQNVAVGDFKEEKKDFDEKDFKFPYIKVHNPDLAVSSSEIRDRITLSKPYRYLVSKEVFEYIKKKGLYGCKDC